MKNNKDDVLITADKTERKRICKWYAKLSLFLVVRHSSNARNR